MQRLELQEPPQSHSTAQLRGLLAVFAETDSPVLVVRHAGPTLNKALTYLRRYLPETIHFPRANSETDYDLSVEDRLDERTGLFAQDKGLHFDINDKPPQPSVAVNAWHLESGTVEGTFLLPGPGLLRRSGCAPDPGTCTRGLQRGFC